jgi:hypothetical protein
VAIDWVSRRSLDRLATKATPVEGHARWARRSRSRLRLSSIVEQRDGQWLLRG